MSRLSPSPCQWCASALLLLAPAWGWAETVVWHPGVTIDCPTTIATADQERTRAIVLPAQAITHWALTAKAKDLAVRQGERNALVLRLANPTFEGTVQVWDENGDLYTVLVRAPADGEVPDDTLILVRAAGAPAGAGAGGGPGDGGAGDADQPRVVNRDTDGAAVHLMAQMVGGVTDTRIRWSAVTTAERGGRISEGRLLHADDNLRITLLRIYKAPTLYGYCCRLEWHGGQIAAFQLQRWFRDGMICSFASDQVLLQARDPALAIAPQRTIQVWYVTDAGAAPVQVLP